MKTLVPQDRLKRRIVRKARCIARDCEQTIRDAQAYGQLRPNSPPIDLEDFVLMRASALAVLRQIGAKP